MKSWKFKLLDKDVTDHKWKKNNYKYKNSGGKH